MDYRERKSEDGFEVEEEGISMKLAVALCVGLPLGVPLLLAVCLGQVP